MPATSSQAKNTNSTLFVTYYLVSLACEDVPTAEVGVKRHSWTCNSMFRLLMLSNGMHQTFVVCERVINSFFTIDDTRSFCGQCRSRSDCTKRVV